MEAVKVPQHLELEDVLAWGLGPVDLLCVFAGVAASWWLHLALHETALLQVVGVMPPAVTGVALGILRFGQLSLRDWLVITLAYALRPRILVAGGHW